MHIIKRFHYHQLERITQSNGIRHYICPDSGKLLPSVTTILDQTSYKPGLLEWRQRVGDHKADQAKQEGLALGNLMHQHLEQHILGEPRPGGNNHIRIMAARMADQIIQRGLTDVDEVWGTETALYVSQLFAGTTDLVGVYRGKPAIIDFKTAKKMRSRDMIEDYLLQVCAYILCHNEMNNTNIDTGVVFMVDRDCNYREFVVEGSEYHSKTTAWFDRLEQYLHC